MNKAMGIEDYKTLECFANDQTKLIETDLKELKKAYDDVGVKTIYRAISISSLSGFAADFLANNPAITAGGIIVGAIKAFAETRSDLRTLNTNPYSYLLSIRQHLEPDTMREKISNFINNPFIP